MLRPAHVNICILYPRHELVNVNLSEKPDRLLERNPNGQTPIIEYNEQVGYLMVFINNETLNTVTDPRFLRQRVPT